MTTAEEYYEMRFGSRDPYEQKEYPSDFDWPKPPNFNTEIPLELNQYMQPEEFTARKIFAAEKRPPVPAPFMDGDYEHRGSAVEHHASPIKEIYVSDEFKPEKNPFRGTADAKEVYHPPSPSFFESSNSDEAPPLPAVNLLSNSNNRHMRWGFMNQEEKKEYYFEKKEEFEDWLNDTFHVRLEESLYDHCEKEVSDYERCMGVATLRKGLTRYSRIRGTMRTMLQCSHVYQYMINCVGEADNNHSELILKQKDKRVTKNLFPI